MQWTLRDACLCGTFKENAPLGLAAEVHLY